MSYFDDGQRIIEVVIGEPSPWRLPRIAIGAIVGVIAILLWRCSEVVEPDQQAVRVIFGRVKFDYRDDGGVTEYQRWRERRVNKKAVRKLRKGGEANKPHLQLPYGKPRIYGPGRYVKLPFTAIAYRKMDTRTRNLDMDIFVQYENQYRAVTQQLQIVLGVQNVFVWQFSGNDIEGTINGYARKILGDILLNLGADAFLRERQQVTDEFINRCTVRFAWYGAVVVDINFFPPVTVTEGWLPTVIAEKDFANTLADALINDGSVAVSAAVSTSNGSTPH